MSAKETCWGFYGAGSSPAFQLLPFLQGTQTLVAMQVTMKRAQYGGQAHSALLTFTFFAPLREELKKLDHC